MFFVSKKKLSSFVLNMLNDSAASYKAIALKDIDAQGKRDAFMLHSGQLTVALAVLDYLKGDCKDGKKRNKRSGKSTAGEQSKAGKGKKAVG